MSNFDEIAIKSFGLGLVTNVSAADADKTSFRQFKNCQAIVPGIGSALPGSGTAQLRVEGTLTNIPALPSSFTLEGDPFIFQCATPGNGSDVIVIFGSKGGRDRFYVWPDITRAGAWSTTTGTKVSSAYISWLELTEALVTTITSVSGAPAITYVLDAATGLDEVTNDYHEHWYAVVISPAAVVRGRTYITAWTAATRTATMLNTVAGATAGDTILIMRFPVFLQATTVSPYYLIDSLPSFALHGQNVSIHTGSHLITSGPDLWLGYIDQDYFGTAGDDLDFTGWHFDHAQPWRIVSNDIAAMSTTGASADPIPYTGSGTDYFVLLTSGLYDGREESNVYFTTGDTATFSDITAATQQFSVAFSIQFSAGAIFKISEYSTTNPGGIRNWSRRIQKIRLYLNIATESTSPVTAFQNPGAFYFVKEVDVNNSSWARVAGTDTFTLTVTITGSDWVAGQGFPATVVNGYEVSLIGANAEREAQVGKRTFIMPIYDDTQKLFRCLFSPIRQSGEVSPEVYPTISRVDVLHLGIPRIVTGAEQNGKLVIFGREKFVVGTVSGSNAGELDESFYKTGCIAARTVRNIENLLFFSSQEKMFEIFDGNRLAEESPAERIQDVWNGLTVAEKEAAFAGVHRDRREYWIAFSDSGIQRIFAYSLKYGIILEYDSDSTYIGFAEGVDGQLYGATSSTIVELVSSTPTESLAVTLESQVFNHDPAQYRRLRMAYLSPSAITIAVINDDDISALREKETLLFLSQDNITEVDKNISLDTARAAWKLTRSATTDTSLQIDSIVFARRSKINR